MRTSALPPAVLTMLLIATSCEAGRLDLDLFDPGGVRFTGGAAAPAPEMRAGAVWVPGNPRDLQAAPKSVQAVAEAGYAGLATAGAAQSLRGGSSRAAKVEAGGFVLVALVSFWRLLKTYWN